ncbi:MAG: hypothetical protein AAGK97_10820, partial [Bacteroidota bacterium]
VQQIFCCTPLQNDFISLFMNFSCIDMKSFWRGVQQKNNKIKYSEIIDGKNQTKEVINIFENKFLNFSSLQDSEGELNLIELLKRDWQSKSKFHIKTSPERLRKLIARLSVGEGHDGISTIFLLKKCQIIYLC